MHRISSRGLSCNRFVTSCATESGCLCNEVKQIDNNINEVSTRARNTRSSVATFLVLQGGGGQDPEMCRQKIYVLILRERAKRASASET